MKNNLFKMILLTTILIFNLIVAYAQMGKHGNVTITGTMVVVNEYTSLISNANAGNTIIYVASNNLNSMGRFSGPLEEGDLIFIIQMKGISINAFKHPDQVNYPTYSLPNDPSWGQITNYNNAGLHEFAQVAGVSGNNAIILSCGLKNNYTASGKVQVIRVPRYNRLSIASGNSITCDIWDGEKGGITVIEIQDRLTLHGNIDVSGRGFRGGLSVSGASNHYGDWQHANNSPTSGEKGEGLFGYQSEYDIVNGRFCRGSAANAGGGGNNHNAGGGGGANSGNPSEWSGQGNPDISNSNWIQAWNIESVNFAYHTSSGGGRGGYSYSFNDRDALNLPPGNSQWGGDYRRNVGGLGGRPLDYTTGRIFMGGGGGAGHQNETYGGNGGRGGGIVYIVGIGTVYGSGLIIANGQNGGNAQGTPAWNSWAGQDGAGGGGAGGTIISNVEGGFHSTSTINIRANGGKGGDQILSKGWAAPSNNEAEGPGGGGSGGYIAIYSGNPIRQALGGANGTTNSTGLTEFPPNGATKGGNGIHDASITPTIINVPSNITVCKGDNVNITASLTGDIPTGAQIIWYDSSVGGNILHIGSTLTIPNIQNTTFVWVGFCPAGWYRKRVLISVVNPIINITPDTTICQGNTIQLNASGGLFYTWFPNSSLNNPNIPNPIASPTVSTLYTVTVSDGFCESVDSVMVTVYPGVNLSTSSDTTICFASSIQLNASGGDSYIWNNASTLSNPFISNPVATPTTSTTYIVTASNIFGCTQTASIQVWVNSLPNISLGQDTTLCEGNSLILNAGNNFISYTWSTGENTQIIQVNQTGTYSVTITDNNNCHNKDTIYVVFLPNLNATITSDTSFCENMGPQQLTAADPNGTWSGIGVTSTGIFNPSLLTPGIYQIIYEISGLCGDSDTVYIHVHSLPTVNLGNDTTYCEGQIITLHTGNNFVSYLWSTQDTTPTIQVTTSNQYSVTITDYNNCQNSDTINLLFLPVADATITPVLGTICTNSDPIHLYAAQPGGQWFGPGVLASGIFNPQVTGSGQFIIEYQISGLCGNSDTIILNVYPHPLATFVIKEESCLGANDASIYLSIYNGSPPYQIIWNTGSTENVINNLIPGFYTVTITDAKSCTSNESTIIYAATNECYSDHIYVPNIFSPNNDGVNDILHIDGKNIESFIFLVYNRWGQKVFENDDIDKGWDGTYKGKNLPEDVYSYVLIVKFQNSQRQQKYSGTITLVR